MTDVGSYFVEQGIGLIEIDYPPVNALGVAVRRALHEGLTRFEGDASVKAIVLICQGRTFFAGGDIREFDKPIEPPFLPDIFLMFEASSKPIVAAIHGTALGGGYEMALVCHYRIAVPSAVVGLPEVKLGFLPGTGGTQRLPRIVGVEAALDIISSGNPVRADRALELGMIDAMAREGELRADAIAFAARIVAENWPLLLVRDREDMIAPARGKPEIYADFLARNTEAFRGFKAYPAIAQAIEAAAELPFDEGYACEQRFSGELMASVESAAQKYQFFAERAAAKAIGLDKVLTRGDGSIVDRLHGALVSQAQLLVRQGASVPRINQALYDYGFPADMLTDSLPREPSQAAAPAIAIAELLYPVINEGARMLGDGTTERASDIDVAAIKALGWPVYTGGPMFWGDRQGLDKIVAALIGMGTNPAATLIARAEAGQSLTAA